MSFYVCFCLMILHIIDSFHYFYINILFCFASIRVSQDNGPFMKHEHNKSMMRAPYNFSLKLQIIFIAHEMSIKCYHFLCPLYLNTVFFFIAKRIFILFIFQSYNSLSPFFRRKFKEKKLIKKISLHSICLRIRTERRMLD